MIHAPEKIDHLAVITLDFDDLMQIRDTPAPEYNVTRAEYADDFDKRCAKDPEWFGNVASASEALALIDMGWPTGVERSSVITSSLDGQIAAVEAFRRRPRWGEDGEELSVDRALAGDWDTAFLDLPKVRTNGNRIITIAGPMGGDCNRNAEELFWNGVQLMVVSDMLEASGYQTEVWGINLCRQWSGLVDSIVAVRAKAAGEPLRLDTMASVFAHAGIFRTFGFSAMARVKTPVGEGFGSPMMSVAHMQTRLDEAARHGWMPECNVVMGNAWKRKEAIDSITATLAKATR